MPLNCPIPFSANRDCGECGDNWGGNCNYHLHSPVPINSRLTDNERLQALESIRDKKEDSLESSYNSTNNIYIRGFTKRGEFLHWQSKLTEHLDRHKKKPKKRLELT